jgi:organic hydroperoxide reductase OsmC/OhrA/CheY-like chemotaxis protein
MSGRVLIVEDSASLALTCRLHLAGQGHTLLEATNGQSALAMLRETVVDCILLDLDLPDMNGAEILRLVRDFPRPPSVVVLTARGSMSAAEQAVCQGAFDYLVKPFNGPRLVTTVRNALAQVALKRELATHQPSAPALRTHRYEVHVTWTGNRGSGTSDYRAYGRDHLLEAEGREPIAGSSDPLFRGDKTRWNPELLQVGAVSACHQLWYLHLCAEAGVVVLDYADDAVGLMAEDSDGSGRFTDITLHPTVTIHADCDATVAQRLHHVAHEKCFIANSVNFPVRCEPRIVTGS